MPDIQDHPEYRGLLAAVKAAPDDDLPRLVLADWLEEHDSPDWAEFIRSQCLLDRFPHAARIRADTYTDAEGVLPDWQQPLTAARRVRELWRQAAIDATPAGIEGGVLPQGNLIPEVTWQCTATLLGIDSLYEYRRGFLERVECRGFQWIGQSGRPLGAELVARQPVRRVDLWDHTPRGGSDSTWSALEGSDRHSVLDDRLPWVIARRLNTPRREVRTTGDGVYHYWHFETTAEAEGALSRAAIAWAEEEAGV